MQHDFKASFDEYKAAIHIVNMLAENAIWLIYLAVGYAYYRNAFDSLRRRERGDRAIGKTDPPKPDTRPPPHPIFAWLTSEKSGYREPN